MGTWDVGPFDNDQAADFALALDEAAPDEREELVRATLDRAVRVPDFLESHHGQEAVGAAALVAAQYPGGERISTGYGPEQPLPPFAAALQPLAVEALDRVLAEDSELAEHWRDGPDGRKWRQSITLLRTVLAPDSAPQKETLFDL
ncbi:DUF4259 domain-containing protein [Streptomyces sp. NPDC004126]|uniref:DUF4259 domain-containing protein n=1 Tax=Streptomyces sp. NPDC004126 TaxID=3390695 RepID=UPI003CFE4ABD